jgi:hypothetical protein
MFAALCPSGVVDLNGMSSPYSGTTVGASHFFDLSCYSRAWEQAPELILSIDVPVSSQITFQETANYASVLELRWGGSCPGETYISCVNGYYNTPSRWRNTQSTAQPVYYIQSGYAGQSGAFTLEWWISGEPPTSFPSRCVC